MGLVLDGTLWCDNCDTHVRHVPAHMSTSPWGGVHPSLPRKVLEQDPRLEGWRESGVHVFCSDACEIASRQPKPG